MSTTKRLAALFGAGVLGLALVGTVLAVATGASGQGVTPTTHEGNIKLVADGNNVQADCTNSGTNEAPIWEGVETGDSSGEATSPGGVTVTWTYDGTTKALSFTATGGLVDIAYVKGGSEGYNTYDYTGFAGGGVAWDNNLFAPNTGANLDHPAGLSHAVFCTGPGTPEASPSFEQSQAVSSEAPPSEAPPSEAPPSFEQSQADTTSVPSEAPSFEQSQGDVTQCPCDTTPGLANTSHPADGAWLLVVALGVLLASVVVLTPARAKNRR
jgi:hypothetical protein